MKRPTMGWSERKNYVILVVISMFFSVIVFIVGRADEINTEHKFCQLITASLAGTPVPQKPADPTKDPSRERLYANYEIVLHLGRSLGCV